MKKAIVVLSESEIKKIEELHATIATYKSLLKNRYMTEEDVFYVEKQLPHLEGELNTYIIILAQKYHIPRSITEKMLISFSDSTLYINV